MSEPALNGRPTARLHSLDLALGPLPPKELRFFRAGPNDSTKGTFNFTPKAGAMVMDAYDQMGRRVSWDYDHGSLNKDSQNPAQTSKSAGSYDLELRNGELWATNIEWTDAARAAITAKEWLWYSPAFTYDPDTLEPNWLINCALTNNPSLYGLEELAAASAVDYRGFPVVDTGHWDADAAEHRIRKWASSDGSGDQSKIDWKKYRQGFAWEAPPAEGEKPKLGDFKLCHHDVQHGELVTSRAGVIAAGAALQGARGGVDIPEADRAEVKRHIAAHYHQWGALAPWEPQPQTAKASDGSRGDQDMSALKTYSDVPAFVKGIGKTKADAAKACGLKMSELDDLINSDAPMPKEHAEKMKAMSADGGKLDVEDDNTSTRTPGPPATTNKDTMPANKANALDVRSFGAALGLLESDVEPRDVLAKLSVLRSDHGSMLAMLGVSSSQQAVRAIAKLQAFAKETLSITGQSCIEDAAAVVAELGAASKEIRETQKKVRKDRVQALLSAAGKANKITPAEVEGPHGLLALGLENPDRLEAMLSARAENPMLAQLSQSYREPTVAPTDGARSENPFAHSAGGESGAKRYEDLSNMDRQALLNSNPQGFASMRKSWEDRGKPVVKKAS